MQEKKAYVVPEMDVISFTEKESAILTSDCQYVYSCPGNYTGPDTPLAMDLF